MKSPWHLWVIGVVTLLFNAGGAFDYVMTQTQNEAYMAQFSEAELAYFYSFPAWVQGSWAIAVWGALLGSLFLVLRRAWAVWAFGVSIVMMLVTMVHNFGLAEVKMHEVVGPEAIWFSGVIVLVTVGTFFYARMMARRGVLR
jgi:hypothetical protein